MSFPTAAVKRYAHVIGGSTPTPDAVYWDGEVNWLTPTDVSERHGGEITTSARTISARGLAACSATLVPAASVVVTTRAPIGNVAVTRLPSATNQGCRTLLLDPRLDPYYLRYQLQVRTEELRSYGAGSTFPELSGAALGRTRVQVPSLDQQRTIVSFLDSECERIGRLSRELETLGAVARSLFRSELGQAVAMVPRTRLKHLGYQVTQGWSPEAADSPPAEGEVGVLRLSAVSTGRFRPGEAKALDESAWQEAENYLLREGDLLLVRASGSLKLLGTVALVEGLGRARLIFPDLVYRLEDGGSTIPRRLLIALLGTSVGEAALTQAKRGAANNKLRLEDVRNLLVPAPRPDQVRSLTAFADRRRRESEAVDGQVRHLLAGLAEYRDALITEAVTGKLDVSRLSDQQMDESAHAAMDGEAHPGPCPPGVRSTSPDGTVSRFLLGTTVRAARSASWEG